LLKKGRFFINEQEILERITENLDIIQELTGYPIKRLSQDKSSRFQRNVKEKVSQCLRILKRLGYLNEDGSLSEKSMKIYSSSIVNWIHKEIVGIHRFGYRKSKILGKDEELYYKFYGIGDSYNEISARKSIRSFLKSKRFVVEKKVSNKGGMYIVLLDVSGSMYGEKIYEAKKSLIAVLYEILRNNDTFRIILFNDKIIGEFSNENNINNILYRIFQITPIGSTDIALALNTAIERIKDSSHVVLITDAIPTYGKNPLEYAIKAAHKIRSHNSSLSIIGINLTEEGLDNAKKLVKSGNGNLYIIENVKDISKILLADYLLYKSKSEEKHTQ